VTNILGLEYDAAACETRYAAGHKTWRQDIGAVTDEQILTLGEWAAPDGGVVGLIGSPPCPAFSLAGNRDGWEDIAFLERHILSCRDGWVAPPVDHEWGSPLSRLTLEPLRWALLLDPEWVALEQVPPVLPLWRKYQQVLEDCGYRVWCGVLNSADYGVPQTRQRAVLMASKRHHLFAPAATHNEKGTGGRDRWVTMAQALGWGMTRRPYTTLTGSTDVERVGGAGSRAALHREKQEGRWEQGPPESDEVVPRRVGFPRADDTGTSEDGYRERDWRGVDEPSFAVTEKARSWIIDMEPPAGDELVVRTNNFTGSKQGDDWQQRRYERSVDEPSPTLGSRVDQWEVGEPGGLDEPPEGHVLAPGSWADNPKGNRRLYDPGVDPSPTVTFGHDASGWRWVPVEERVLNTGRAWKKGGTRDDAQTVDPLTNPAPTVTAESGMQWQMRERKGIIDGDVDEVPDGAEWTVDRPATTIAGDPRAFPPGGHAAAGREHLPGRSEGAIRLTVPQALVLQSFPPDYPVDGLETAPHVAQGLSVEQDRAIADELVSQGRQRGVHFTVLPIASEDDEVVQVVVRLDAVDVVHNLRRLRPGDHAVLRCEGPGGEHVPAADAGVGTGFPVLVCVQRVTVQPPLLPVLGAETAGDGFAFAVLARRLRWPTVQTEGAVPVPLVVHEAHSLGAGGAVAVFDGAGCHTTSRYHLTGSTRSKQFQQVGNAVPPGLAEVVLRDVIHGPPPPPERELRPIGDAGVVEEQSLF
jgi:site-specific DNA-cytosine methylase